MTGDDPGLFVVPGSVAGELEDLGGEILHDGHIETATTHFQNQQ